jgi:glycosyltransferase involved in cell wall biosynthesis
MVKNEGHIRISVVICALNEEPNLPHVLPNVPAYVDEILLVDGHSTDNTVEAAKRIRPDIKVLFQPGRGKGDALKYGVEHAKGDIIVTLDADGETPPDEILNFVKPLFEGYDIAKGSRLTNNRPHRMPRHRWFGNKVLVLTFNWLYGAHFNDICSGFNAFWKSKFLQLELSYGANEIGCSMEQRMIIRAKKTGMKIKEVPYTSEGRLAGTSVISGFRQSMKQGFIDWFIIIGQRFRG